MRWSSNVVIGSCFIRRANCILSRWFNDWLRRMCTLKSIRPRMPPIWLPARFASFSVCVAISCPWAMEAEARDLAHPPLAADPNTMTISAPTTEIHNMISTGPLPSRNRRNGAK